MSSVYTEAVIMDIGNKAPEQARKDDLLRDLYKAGPAALLDDLRTLKTVLDAEEEALADMRIDTLQQNEATKRELIERMQIYTAIMKERPEWATALPEHEREELRALRKHTDAAGERVLLSLAKMRRLHGVFMNAIRKSVDKGLKTQSGYGEAGACDHVSRGGGTAFSLNENC